MPREISKVHADGQDIDSSSQGTRQVVEFLEREPHLAFSFQEIAEGVFPIPKSGMLAPYAPFWFAWRAVQVGATLDGLLSAGRVRRVRDRASTWYHLTS